MGALKIIFAIMSFLAAALAGLGLIVVLGADGGSSTDYMNGEAMVSAGGYAAIAFAVLAVAMAIGEAAGQRRFQQPFMPPQPQQYPVQPPGGPGFPPR